MDFSKRRLLLLSNSTNAGEQFLGWPEPYMKEFLGGQSMNVLFIPFAAVRLSLDEYARLVRERLAAMGHSTISLHERKSDPLKAVNNVDAIMIGGGNTFNLLKSLYDWEVIAAIRARVLDGAPFIGWSAGSNVSAPTIRTTNDMPVVEPPSLNALSLVPFQINPHYTNLKLPGHGGETRDDRLNEFIEVNRDVNVIGLRESTLLRVEGNKMHLLGTAPARIFRYGAEAREVEQGSDMSDFLTAAN